MTVTFGAVCATIGVRTGVAAFATAIGIGALVSNTMRSGPFRSEELIRMTGRLLEDATVVGDVADGLGSSAFKTHSSASNAPPTKPK
jgi:hypothetical protein